MNGIRWKSERYGDDGESEPAEGRSSRTRQGATKTLRPRVPGNGRTVSRYLPGMIIILTVVLVAFPQ